MITLADWKDRSKQDILKEFTEDPYNESYNVKKEFPDYDRINILVAYYSYENYSGNAFVLYELDNKLFEVNGSHCSCNQLEGQWSPEETTIEAVQHRIDNGLLGVDEEWNPDTNTYEKVDRFKSQLEKMIHDLKYNKKFDNYINEKA